MCARDGHARVAMKRCIIDDRGRIWASASAQLRALYHLSGDNATVEAALTRLVGCIAMRHMRQGLTVELHPRIVSGRALAQLLYYLSDHQPRRVSLVVGDAKLATVYWSVGAAVTALGQLVRTAQHDPSGSCTLSDLAVELIDEDTALGQLLRRRNETAADFSLELFGRLLEQGLGGRWIALKPAGADDMRVVGCGTGFGIPTPDACRSLAGAMLSSLPDQRFASWLASSYANPMQARRPTYQLVRTVAYWPDAGVVESEYARLVVPVSDSDGSELLLSVSRRLGLQCLTGRTV